MQPRVTAILVAHSGSENLARTLAGLVAQTRPADAALAVTTTADEKAEAVLATGGFAHILSVRDGTPFGSALAHAAPFAPAAESDNEWLWILSHDSAPEPDALAQLLATVERAPSVVVAGPKLMRHDRPDTIAAFGETMSTLGASVGLVDDELDQAQHDTRDDVLGVAAAGMLVKRSVWRSLGGFDPGLPSIDASLDFCVRARLAGHRVVLVPGARVASTGGPETFGRTKVSERRRFRVARAAQLHRRLVYSPGWAVPVHWLSLVPLAVARSILDLLAKRPGVIGGEFRAAFRAAFGGRVGAARKNFGRTKKLGWGAIAPLRMPLAELRERRAQAREAELVEWETAETQAAAHTTSAGAETPPGDNPAGRAGFVQHGGLWVVVLAGLVGVVAYGALLGTAVSGGGLLPLSETVSALWANIGYGWRQIGVGTLGAADPFAAVLAIMGSLTFWSPSFSIVLTYLLALPLAALGAWFAGRRLTKRPSLPALAAVLWALAPPLLTALAAGRLGAVLAHLLLPWLVLAALNARRSWAAGASASLLFAGVAASAPSLVPALLALLVVLVVARPGSIHRVIGIPIPALALFAPLIIQQVIAGNPLGLLADPGVPFAHGAASGWQLALADPVGSLHHWPATLTSLAVSGALPGFAPAGLAAPIVVAVLLAPLGVLALLSLFLPGAGRTIWALSLALLGFVTAVGATHVQVGAVGTDAVTVWAGSGLSLYWLGLVAATVFALGTLGRATVPLSVLSGITVAALAIPTLGAVLLGTAAIHPAGTRILPALVTAEARTHPSVGTLVIGSLGDAGVAVHLERGLGSSLDDQSTLVSTKLSPNGTEFELATLAGNLAVRSGYDSASVFAEHGIRFVLVRPGTDDDETYRTMVDALDSNEILAPIGSTSGGLLWRYSGDMDAVSAHPGNTDTAFGTGYLVALGIVFGITVLLAIPTGRRRRVPRPAPVDEPADTFDEEPHD